jgi:hypothetical protein
MRFGTNKGSLVLLFLLCVSGVWSQAAVYSDEEKQEQQVKADETRMSEEQQKLAEYQQQAQFYDRFAQKRLQFAREARVEIEARIKQLEDLQAKGGAKTSKSKLSQEIGALKNWLTAETAGRKQMEEMQARWHAAIENVKSQIAQTKFTTDVDKSSLAHQQEIDKENAARQADNPKPAPPVVQQNTILAPGFESMQGDIPVMLGGPYR